MKIRGEKSTRALTSVIDTNICLKSKRSTHAYTRNYINNLVSHKRSQMKISFGMIFSIILIIAFIAFAFYAIKLFLGVSDEAKIGKFIENLRGDVNRLWQSSHASQVFTYELPNKVEKVCFVENGYKNLAFIPRESSSFIEVNITHFDIAKTLDESNENNVDDGLEKLGEGLCFENNGKINILLKKDYGEEKVYARIP